MTKKKNTIPPKVIQTFEDCQGLFPAGYVKKLGKSKGIEYYQFIIPDGENGPLKTGFPLVCSWDGRDVKELEPEDALDAVVRFC